MSGNSTGPTGDDPSVFLDGVLPERRREEGRVLLDLFTRTTGFPAVMWGPSIIGFGRYHYTYASGREGDFLATGFSPRKARHSIYVLPGYQDYGDILVRLGKHKLGKSCLYVNKLDDIDLAVLEELIRAGLRDLDAVWPVSPR